MRARKQSESSGAVRRHTNGGPGLIGCVGLFGLSLLCGCVSAHSKKGFADIETTVSSNITGIEVLNRFRPCRAGTTSVVKESLKDGLTVDEAVRIALSNNHRIQAAYERLDIAAADRLAARLLSNPEVEGSWKISEEDSDEDVLEIAAELDALRILLLPALGRIGDREFAAVKMDVTRAVQKLAYDTRIAYLRVLAARKRLAMRQSVLQASEAARLMAERLRDAGNIKLIDRLNREAMYEQARLAVSGATLALSEAREDLNVLMGLSSDCNDWDPDGSLPETIENAPEPETVQTNAIRNSISLAMARERISAGAAWLGIARAKSVLPALHIGVEAEREPEGVWMTGPMIAIELPLFDWGQARRPEAAAALRKLQHEYAAQTIEISAAARTAWKRVSISAERVKRYRDTIMPLQERILHRTQLQYNAMQLGVFSLLQAKQMEIAVRAAYIDELLNYRIALTEMEQIRKGLPVESRTVDPAGADMSAGSGGGGH